MNRSKLAASLAAGAAAVSLVATGVAAVLVAGTRPAEARQVKLSANDRMFMRMAAVSNRGEIMTSQLALKKSQDPKVRRIAQMLITEHGQALRDLKMLAQLKQYSLPTTTDAKNMAAYRRLSRLSGRTFDKQYVLLQTRSHNAAVRLHREQMERANDTNVRSYAAKYYAPVFSHTEMIQEVAQAYNIPVAEREEGQPMNTNRASSASKP